MKRSHEGVAKSRYSDPDYDLLGSQEFRKSYLVSMNLDPVPVENLRGKIVALYFLNLNKQYPLLNTWIINFYKAVMHKNDPNFDMVFVAIPPSPTVQVQDQDSVYDDDESVEAFNTFISTLPFASVPFQDRDWRSHLSDMYMDRSGTSYFYHDDDEDISPSIQVTIIDTCNKGNVLHQSRLGWILKYGPYLHPFTADTVQKAMLEFGEFGQEDITLQELLGSDTRDYLLDSRSNKVPISELDTYEFIGIYAYSKRSANIGPFRSHLKEIYDKFNYGGHKRFEIVFIDLIANSSYCKEDEEMPWLKLPVEDGKTWILANMLARYSFLGRIFDYTRYNDGPDHPQLLIKPKGASCLELYGYHIIEHFGEDAFPFTERTLVRHAIKKLKRWTLASFVDQAAQVGLDLNRFVRHNIEKGEEEEVTLSSLGESSKVLIFMFASCRSDETKKALAILNEAYKSQAESLFEVIFVSPYLKNTYAGFETEHLSGISWLALQERPKSYGQAYSDLTEKTENLLSFSESAFVTFAPDGTLLGAGLLVPFEIGDFPFMGEDELMKHAGLCLLMNHNWWVDELKAFRWLGLQRRQYIN